MNVTDAVSCARQVARGSKLPQDDICGTVVKVYLPHIFGKMPKMAHFLILTFCYTCKTIWKIC